MNIWNIARVELRRYLRDVRLLSIMLAFPIVLMLILGVALSGSFHMETKIGEMRVLYSVSSAEGMLPHAWSSFIKEAEKAGVRFVHAPDPEEGLQEARRGRFTGYVEVASDGLSYSGSHGVENQIVHGVLAAFTDRYKSAAAVASVDSSLVLQSNPNHENYIREVSLTGSKQPRALDYYAVSLTAMMVLFGSIGGSLLISS
ncbi:MAG: transporter permease, partial [Paenibacillus sp.]|nr:transporter permease [Paenibacillus sp.]